MNRISLATQRQALVTVIRAASPRGLGLRAAEFDLLIDQLVAVSLTLAAIDAHPDIAEQLRERLRAEQRGAP